ncbi:WXG100 family type VII secretion target [Streptosporangium soli]|nr:WXG100 family type VII secretion target [Streptosporangium sp. KLBMP 9127]
MPNPGERISAHFDGMNSLAEELNSAYTQFMGELEDMENDLKVLETWQGAAGDVYREEKLKWDQAQLQVSATFQRLAPTMQNANDILQEAERQNVARW